MKNLKWGRIVKKRANSIKFALNPLEVPKAGIEPAHLAVHDFESCASTSSATQAKRPADVLIGLQIWANFKFRPIYSSINFMSENAWVRSENNVFTRPQTLPNNSDLRYASRSASLFQ